MAATAATEPAATETAAACADEVAVAVAVAPCEWGRPPSRLYRVSRLGRVGRVCGGVAHAGQDTAEGFEAASVDGNLCRAPRLDLLRLRPVRAQAIRQVHLALAAHADR